MALARKLCLIGDFAVGKTSLIRRYVHNDFSLNYEATVGVQIHQYNDTIDADKKPIPFAQIIWDIEGSRFGQELIKSYVLGAAGAVIVGDATRSDAIPSMSCHARSFLDILPGRPIVFAMNKSDLLVAGERLNADELAATFGAEIIMTSALNGNGVRSLFHALGRRVLEVGA